MAAAGAPLVLTRSGTIVSFGSVRSDFGRVTREMRINTHHIISDIYNQIRLLSYLRENEVGTVPHARA